MNEKYKANDAFVAAVGRYLEAHGVIPDDDHDAVDTGPGPEGEMNCKVWALAHDLWVVRLGLPAETIYYAPSYEPVAAVELMDALTSRAVDHILAVAMVHGARSDEFSPYTVSTAGKDKDLGPVRIIQTRHYYGPRRSIMYVGGVASPREWATAAEAHAWIWAQNANPVYLDHNESSRPDYVIVAAY